VRQCSSWWSRCLDLAHTAELSAVWRRGCASRAWRWYEPCCRMIHSDRPRPQPAPARSRPLSAPACWSSVPSETHTYAHKALACTCVTIQTSCVKTHSTEIVVDKISLKPVSSAQTYVGSVGLNDWQQRRLASSCTRVVTQRLICRLCSWCSIVDLTNTRLIQNTNFVHWIDISNNTYKTKFINYVVN